MPKKGLFDDILKHKKKRKRAVGADRILLRANRKAERIIEKAAEDADLLVSEAEILSDELKNELEDTFRKNIRKWTAKYEKVLRERIEKSMEGYGMLLQTELQSSQKVLRRKVDEEFARAKAEIEQYKKNRMKEVDESVAKAVKEVSLDVLDQSISPEVYEEMVIKALEKAKKKGVFGK